MSLLDIVRIIMESLGAAFAITVIVCFFVLFSRGFDH